MPRSRATAPPVFDHGRSVEPAEYLEQALSAPRAAHHETEPRTSPVCDQDRSLGRRRAAARPDTEPGRSRKL
jgi:hypothetical protein